MPKEREIWFRRVMWGFVPNHWKGWTLYAVSMVGFFAIYYLLTWLIGMLGHPQWELIPALAVGLFLFGCWIVYELHIPPRR